MNSTTRKQLVRWLQQVTKLENEMEVNLDQDTLNSRDGESMDSVIQSMTDAKVILKDILKLNPAKAPKDRN